MDKKHKSEIFGAASLLAGTAIGSGMISLPMVLAKLGIVGTFVIMVFFMFLIYFTAIIRADISLHTNVEISSLKQAGEKVGCAWVGKMGDWSLKLLAFALMTAYMTGGASIISSVLGGYESHHIAIGTLALVIALVFFFCSHLIVNLNKSLFSLLTIALFALIAFLLYQTPISVIPHQAGNLSWHSLGTLITVVFTSFGFHTVTHAIAKICNNDRRSIRLACLFGTAIPTAIYIFWTVAILLVVANTDANFFQLMLVDKATEVGDLVKVLSLATSNASIQRVVWIVSALAILTSILGVGFALWHTVRTEWKAPKWISACVVAILPAVISITIPNAFIAVLSIAGVLLSVVAIISPVIISLKIYDKSPKESIVGSKAILYFTLLIGIFIIVLGIL